MGATCGCATPANSARTLSHACIRTSFAWYFSTFRISFTFRFAHAFSTLMICFDSLYVSPSPLKMTPSARSALRQRLRSVVLTAESYVSAGGQLKPNDAEGFMAAGALLWLRGHPSVLGGAGPIVLMAAERREREAEVKLNFLGGKRDAVGESARDTAARECVDDDRTRTPPAARALSHATP